jgi:hypothetical protein
MWFWDASLYFLKELSMKLLILIVLFLFLSCGSNPESQKEQRAVQLYNRICSIVHGSGDFTTEWKTIVQRVFDGRDTVFLTNNGDFQILVTVRHAIITDTVPLVKPETQAQDSSKNAWK